MKRPVYIYIYIYIYTSWVHVCNIRMINTHSSGKNVTAHVCHVIGRNLQTFWRNRKSYPNIFLVGHVRGTKTFRIVILRAGISTPNFPNAKGGCYPICCDVHSKLRMSGVLTSLLYIFPWYGVLARDHLPFEPLYIWLDQLLNCSIRLAVSTHAPLRESLRRL